MVVITGTVNTSVVGTYILTYSVTDSSGNGPVSVIRYVEVVDTYAPVITSKDFKDGDTVNVEVFDYFKDPVFAVNDNYYKTIQQINQRNIRTCFPDL